MFNLYTVWPQIKEVAIPWTVVSLHHRIDWLWCWCGKPHNCLYIHSASDTQHSSDEELCDEVWRSKHDDHWVQNDALPTQLPGPLHAGHVHHHLGDSGNHVDFNAEHDFHSKENIMFMITVMMDTIQMKIMQQWWTPCTDSANMMGDDDIYNKS